jgi:isopentenyl-diphosphate Delta-isomerase
VNMQRPKTAFSPVATGTPSAEMLVLVSEQNRRLGTAEKMDVHVRGLLHRAFSIFLVDDSGRILLQRRFSGKYHSGNLWANTCCGHPRPFERTSRAAVRRLGEELGLSASLHFAFRARYETPLDHGLTENELVYVYLGRITGEPALNPLEVSETKLVTLDELIRDVHAQPTSYAYWLRHYLDRHSGDLRSAIQHAV